MGFNVSSGLIAFMLGVGIGLVILTPVLWRYRREIKQSWQAALGLAPERPAAVSQSSHGRDHNHRLSSGKRWLAIGVSLVASLGNAVLAIQASEERLFHLFGVVLFAVAAGLLMLTGWPQEDN
jgi:uncharacterized membrane protein YfcA